MTSQEEERETDPETRRETLGYWGYRSAEWLAMSLPERTGRRVFETLGRVAHRRLHGVRATVAANQARVLGAEPSEARVDHATREAFELYARFWFDAFRIRTMPEKEFNERIVVFGVENIDRALEAGKGCVCALPHMGNWDAAGHWFGANGYRIAAGLIGGWRWTPWAVSILMLLASAVRASQVVKEERL